MLVGVGVPSRWTEIASDVAAGWLTMIAAKLRLAGFFDIAVRDLVVAVTAVTLALLTAVHDAAAASAEPRRVPDRDRLVA